MLSGFQHYLNPLHLYCRMRDLGLPKRLARIVGRVYESTLFKCFYRRG